MLGVSDRWPLELGSARNGGKIRQGKTTNPVWIPGHSELKKISNTVTVLGPLLSLTHKGKLM